MDINTTITPTLISSLSQELYEKKEHVLLGISPFNSYFSEEMIGHWIQWAERSFASFNIFLPDTLPIHTFMALGYSQEKAQSKARRQAAYLKNKVIRALSNRRLTDINPKDLIIDMGFLEKNEAYNLLKDNCYRLYNKNPNFKKECDQCTEWVLNGHTTNALHSVNRNIAVQYILDEMPLFMDTPSILNTTSSLFSYHQTPQFMNYLYTNHIQNKFIALNQGFIELSVHTNKIVLSEELARDES